MTIAQLIPIIAVFIAGILALFQIRANNITSARLKWLETLKSYITEFLAEVTILTIKKGVQKQNDIKRSDGNVSKAADAFDEAAQRDLIDHLKTIQIKYDLIRLNLNLWEKPHIEFENLLKKYMSLVNQIPLRDAISFGQLEKEMDDCSIRIIKLARLIIKLEWEQAKQVSWIYVFYKCYGKGKRLKKEVDRILLTNDM